MTRRRLVGVSATVWYLGATSLLADVSSEMVTSIVPAYLVLSLHVTPVAFGIVDGLYQGVAPSSDRPAGFSPIAFEPTNWSRSSGTRSRLSASWDCWPLDRPGLRSSP